MHIIVPRIKGPVTLDGQSREPAWEDIRPIFLIQMEPHFGVDPSHRTVGNPSSP